MLNKKLILILGILFVISTICGTYGLILSKDDTNITPKKEEKEKITYEYYLEDQLVDEMPAKTDENENTYEFSKYECSKNNVKIDFDDESWAFIPSSNAEGVCKLYFVKSAYQVEITATNGLVNGEEATASISVPRETDGQLNVVPNEGYEFDGTITCSNDKEATYDISTNTLNINSVSEDVACKVNFKKKVLKLDIVVKNGTGTTTENKEFGESVSAIVQPNEGYEKPVINCTNNQEFTYKDNKITITKLTNNSVCTVTFNKTPAVTYNLTIDNIPETVTITSGNKKQSVVSGKDGKFSLRADEGYKIILDCNGVRPSNEKSDPDGSITYTFLGVSRNITCNIKTEWSEQ